MVYRLVTPFIFLILSFHSHGQTDSYDSLKQAIIKLDQRVNQVELNLETSQKKFRSGILIATLGYTTTITGGLMLGRKNDNLGQVLLVTGGTTGILGTYKMVDAFRFLTGSTKKKKKKKNY